LFDKEAKMYKATKLTGNFTGSSEGGTIFVVNDFKKLIGFQNSEEEKFKIKVVGYIADDAYISKEEHFILTQFQLAMAMDLGVLLTRP
jgi:hypothetical protein